MKMGRYTFEQKVQACEDIISRKRSPFDVARDLNVPIWLPLKWWDEYEEDGPEAFLPESQYTEYPKEFKEAVVDEWKSHSGPVEYFAQKYHIPRDLLLKWINRSMEGEDLDD